LGVLDTNGFAAALNTPPWADKLKHARFASDLLSVSDKVCGPVPPPE